MAEQQEIVDSAVPVNAEPEEDMELETVREENEENGSIHKKQKVEEKSAEEVRLENKKDKVNGSGRVKLGPREFVSSVEMYDYFNNLLHFWPHKLDVNKSVLLDLIKKGHPEAEEKIGVGVKAFQIRNHPIRKSRCFFIVREDESEDEFSFRDCVEHIHPLPKCITAPNSIDGGNVGRRGGGNGGKRGGGNGGRRGGGNGGRRGGGNGGRRGGGNGGRRGGRFKK